MAKHYATPYEHNGQGLIYSAGEPLDEHCGAMLVCDTADDDMGPSEREIATADFIALACNSHVQLIEALVRIMAYTRHDSSEHRIAAKALEKVKATNG